MGYSDYKYYKPTIWDKMTIEGSGLVFIILLLAGIWINEFRWKLIFTALFFFLLSVVQVKVVEDREEKLRNIKKTRGKK